MSKPRSTVRSRVSAARVAAAFLTLLVCVGCSAAADPTPNSGSQASESVPASETPQQWKVSPQTSGGAPIGQTVTASSGDAQVAIAVRDTRRIPAADSGGTQDAVGIDVEICPNIPITASSEGHWILVDNKDGKYQPAEINSANLAPQFPFQPQPVEPGQCVRGWVMFEVDPATAIVNARYLGAGNINIGWIMPKQ